MIENTGRYPTGFPLKERYFKKKNRTVFLARETFSKNRKEVGFKCFYLSVWIPEVAIIKMQSI